MGRKVWVCCPFVYWVMSDVEVTGCEKLFPGPITEIDLSATHILSYQGNLVHQFILLSLLILYPII